MSGQSPNPLSVTAELAARLERPVSSADRWRAVMHILDWAGCAVAGADSPAARAMRQGLGDTMNLTGDRHGCVLYLGALGNVLEMDDVDKRALLHPGPVVIPAAFVAAMDAGADAAAFLNGVVRGYEAVIRIGRAVGPAHYRYWHNTGTCGPFGAAAAAASIYNLDREQLTNALGHGGAQASGFWQTRHEPESQAKQLHTARAAHAGWVAATLARAGLVGVKSILEGEQGFFAATCGDADAHAVTAFANDAPWTIHDVSFKPWPACRHAHAAIDAAIALRGDIPDLDNVQAFTIRTYKDAIVFCDNPAPTDTLSAKFSVQHAVAVALLHGPPSLADFDGARLNDPGVAALRRKIRVVDDERFSHAYPAQFGAAIDAELSDGRRCFSEIPDALGDPENPATDMLITTKAMMLMEAGGVSATGAARLRDTVMSLCEHDGKFETFADLLIGEALP